MIHKLLLPVVLFCLNTGANAQPMLFEHINEKQGLSQNSVHSVTTDAQGYLWLGTDDGLNRFDGYTFDIYRTDEKNPKSILPGKIMHVSCQQSTVALLTENGISTFNTRTFEATNFLFPKKLVKPRLIFDLTTLILVGADNGLFLLNPANGEFTQTHITDPVTGFAKMKQGVIAIGASSGLYLFYPFNKKTVPVIYSPGSYIMDIAAGKNMQLHWVESNGTVFSGKLSGQKMVITRKIELPELNKSNGIIEYENNLIIGTPNGILKVNHNGEKSNIVFNEDEPFSLSNNKVLCVYADDNKNLWVGTGSGGINKYHPYRFKFPCIGPGISNRFNQLKDIIAFSQTKEGTILFSNAAGAIGLFNMQSGELIDYHPIDLVVQSIIPANNDSSLFLIGTTKGLYSYSLKEKSVKKLNTVNAVKPFIMDVKSIIHFNNNQYWAAGGDGLFLFDLKEEKTIAYYGVGNSRLGSNNIRNILLNKPDELLLASSAGLYRLNLKTQLISQIKITREKKEPFITQIKKDKMGNIWIGTLNQGVFKINKDNSLEKMNTYNGLSNNNIYGILPVNEKNEIWFSTNAGISRYRLNGNIINNYDIYDGLQGNEFIESSQFVSKEGTLLFGGTNGFNYFNPDAIKNDEGNCKVVIKKILVFNKEIPFSQYYNFDYQNNYLTIEFVALDFNLSGNNQYYYKLEGLQTDWTESGNRRFASFGQLHAGNYVFKVRATNGDGKLCQKEAAISFSIVPPFWLTWWFRIGFILLVAGGVALFIYLRVKSVIEEEQEKTKNNKMMAELELKALRAQMNPHFIFNSLNSIQDFVLNNEGAQAAKYLSKFARLMRMILDISEQTIVNIQQKIAFLKLYVELEALRMNNNFTYRFEIEESFEMEGQIPTLLVQPHIENAIWHGLQYKEGEKKLIIRIKKLSEDILLCEVEDNGIGREAGLSIKKNKTILHQSKGIRITEDRMKILKRTFGQSPKIEIIDLKDKNNVACGTKVLIQIPVING